MAKEIWYRRNDSMVYKGTLVEEGDGWFVVQDGGGKMWKGQQLADMARDPSILIGPVCLICRPPQQTSNGEEFLCEKCLLVYHDACYKQIGHHRARICHYCQTGTLCPWLPLVDMESGEDREEQGSLAAIGPLPESEQISLADLPKLKFKDGLLVSKAQQEYADQSLQAMLTSPSLPHILRGPAVIIQSESSNAARGAVMKHESAMYRASQSLRWEAPQLALLQNMQSSSSGPNENASVLKDMSLLAAEQHITMSAQQGLPQPFPCHWTPWLWPEMANQNATNADPCSQ